MRLLLAALGLMVSLASGGGAQNLWTVEQVQAPSIREAREPKLFVDARDQLFMIWTETAANGFTVKHSRLGGTGWTTPVTVIESSDLFVNWADVPSLARFADGTIVTHWLQKSGKSPYAYDVHLALSKDGDESWSTHVIPHRDGTKSQHGFVTLLPFKESMIAFWLDGRAYSGGLVEAGAVDGAMQLRSTVISSDGTTGEDIALDLRTCSCCQTAAAVAGDTVLVAYRDRTADEIRDISIVRMRDGSWSKPSSVHDDGWEISGCPVNGPAIAAEGDQVFVAWFTGANDVPAVKVAQSSNAGLSFSDPTRIDLGKPVGRVDAVMLDAESALISWVEWEGAKEHLFVCRATSLGCGTPQRIATNSSGASVNFPDLASTSAGVFLAWTQTLSDGRDSIQMVKLRR